MEKIICRKCKSTEYFTIKNGPHLEARCSVCQKHIKFLPQERDPGEAKMYFGMYEGKMLKEIPFDYLDWALVSLDRPTTVNNIKIFYAAIGRSLNPPVKRSPKKRATDLGYRRRGKLSKAIRSLMGY